LGTLEVVVVVVEEEEEEEFEEAGASCMPVVEEEEEENDFEVAMATCKAGSTAREMIRAKISNDRDFMKTLQAANLRY
jgi:hypothetical protein